ncbi:hypothetical protein PFICI_14792 [Pestalotiopsis fici W106-1]|uniref:CRAL-TRIO domain-containing protein n=1 Tax=Pestalotiopsis fici (strain W106-1 / CGMCC3.15140) TaxID=1229662 RepID=W3WM18_PESFW|nr:uncharacterized protein PFICI_14792 [Pestalotiopsis fici W106-1]ETS73846.1 hypothetical protein PFICI_14792 [Pestalotiopsis fici W106-1]
MDSNQDHKLQLMWRYLIQLCGVPGSEDGGAASWPRLTDMTTDEFRHELWNFILAEHPDALVLRFLRARKYNVEAAMAMLLSAVRWRRERQLDKTVILIGESVGLKDGPSEDDKGFIAQYRSGKSYVRGTDKENRPIYVIKVGLHDPNMQSAEAMETYILHNVESIRFLAKPPQDKFCLLFDMTGLGLRNMDFHVVKFLLLIFEAKYPETLGLVLIHNAPFVFWGLWNIIKGWLDPVIASKINFTRKTGDLLKFISEENLQSNYGGRDEWQYKYIEPEEGENAKLSDGEQRGEIEKERDELINRFEQETIQWAALPIDQPSMKRNETAVLLRENYWKLDPYIRSTTYYKRAGVVDTQGNVDFHAAK